MVSQSIDYLLIVYFCEVMILSTKSPLVENLRISVPLANPAFTPLTQAPFILSISNKVLSYLILVHLRTLIKNKFRMVKNSCENKVINAALVFPAKTTSLLTCMNPLGYLSLP